MRVLNARIDGFSTNSSSSHSIVIINDKKYNERFRYYGREFGWQFAVVDRVIDKRAYLAVLVYSNMISGGGIDINSELYNNTIDLCKRIDPDFSDPGGKFNFDAYIDHQSVIDLPLDFDCNSFDEDFIFDFLKFLERDDVVIRLGNDNETAPYGMPFGRTWDHSLPRDTGGPCGVARREIDDIWTIFDRSTGRRISLSFGDSCVLPEKLHAPWLIDVKITDFCPYGCTFCYQSSTAAGEHAPFSRIEDLATQASEMKVFEVALGGGEPTMHPMFAEVLKSFRSRNVVPNFTTYSVSWMSDDTKRNAVIDNCGGFAFSAFNNNRENPINRVSGAIATAEKYGIPVYRMMSVQVVMGLQPIDDIIDLIRFCKGKVRCVTLLGYKSVGRGSNVAPYDYSQWLGRCLSLNWYELPNIGIDTKLAAQSGIDLKSNSIPEWLYFHEEGRVSMYVDLVESRVGSSSYHDNFFPYEGDLAAAWDSVPIVSG